jgi:hypothetical protein
MGGLGQRGKSLTFDDMMTESGASLSWQRLLPWRQYRGKKWQWNEIECNARGRRRREY